MRRIQLNGTNIETSALGFGTSALMGRLTKYESLRLLEIAYESGIRHFDTAPLYGYGESEIILGEFLRSHPDTTVATKFGLLRPRGNSFLFQRAKIAARPLLRAFPEFRSAARKAVAASVTDVADYDPEKAVSSLTTSLKRLHRDKLDLLLLHECRQADLQDDRLLEFLIRSKERGLIRAFGIATDFATVSYSLAEKPAYAEVLQFPNNRAEPNLQSDSGLAAARACITHSPFGGFGKSRPETVDRALQYAIKWNPNGIVLFSSQSAEHIAENAKVFVASSSGAS